LDAEPMRQCVDLLRGFGVRTSMLSVAELSSLDPSVRVDDLACAAYEPDAGYCDPMRASLGFVAAFERGGGQVTYGARVTGLQRGGATWRVATSLGAIETPVVVNAAGAYARWLAGLAGVHVPIEHYAHDVAAFTPRAARMALYDMVGMAYYRPDGDAATVVGSMNWSEGARVLDDPDAFPWTANPQVVARLHRALSHRYACSSGLSRAHAGIYFVTPDRYPILGFAPDVDGLFLACGFSHGFKVSPAVGKAVAARIVEGPRAAPELDDFRLSRFAESQPIKPLYPYVSGIQT
jgi:sarcosine oxidase subunit beta